MYIVLPAARHFEYIVADGVRHPLCIGVPKDFAQLHAGDTVSRNGFLRYYKTPVDESGLALDPLNLIALRNFIPLVEKAVISGDDKTVCIRAGGDTVDQVNDF